MSYTIKETSTRISAVDDSGVEIVGAQIPHGDVVWKLYMTQRMTENPLRSCCHPVVCSRDGARQWVVAIAALYSRATGSQEGAA